MSKEAARGSIISSGQDIRNIFNEENLVNFNIIVDNLTVVGNKVLAHHMRGTSYDLWHAWKAFLHGYLRKQISSALTSRVIVEAANIFEVIMSSYVPSLKDLAMWKNFLE
jgi:hypothetical protein